MGEKELTRRELMSDMTPLSGRTAGSWELPLTECVCVSVCVCGNVKESDGVRKGATRKVNRNLDSYEN